MIDERTQEKNQGYVNNLNLENVEVADDKTVEIDDCRTTRV